MCYDNKTFFFSLLPSGARLATDKNLQTKVSKILTHSNLISVAPDFYSSEEPA